MEGRGLPTVVLGTHPFAPLAATAAAALGRPHLPLVTVAHPLGGIDPAQVMARAETAVERVLLALTRDPAPPAAVPDTAARTEAPADLDEFQAFALAEGWGDGLPVLPPTLARIERLLAGRRAEAVLATLPPRGGLATLVAIAANAALAGAGPEHLPVIAAAVRALADPRFNLDGVQATTHPCTPLLVVNGPIARRLGINGGPNALGQGHRANAVIGRAVRLVLQNVGGAVPGLTDRATHGHPGKFTYCVAENEAASPWEPLHVQRGFEAEASCVTVCASEGPHNVNDHASTSAEGLLRTLAGTAATPGNNNIYLGGEPLLLLGPEHAQTIAGSGWSKHDLQRAFWERARVPVEAFGPENLQRFVARDPEHFGHGRAGTTVPVAGRPEDVMVVVAGGPGKHSAVIPTFGSSQSVTLQIED